jgi:hypothetical protein
MRKAFAILWLGLGLTGPALADPAAIRTVIENQIAAFERDDVEQAFTYASPTIRQMFRTPDRFGAMVQRGYPMVWRPEDLQFLDIEKRAGRFHQPVMIRDTKGALHILDYEMIEGEAGWKIDAVRLREPAGAV